MFAQYLKLRSQGIMGMNRRNIDYIARYNSRSLFPLVDDKLKTKTLALDHGVTVPSLIGVVNNQYSVKGIDQLVAGHEAFCVKPAKGSGGKGILVVAGVKDGRYYKTSGQSFGSEELQRHVSNILAGLFSLGGATDVAMVESCIVAENSLQDYSFEGVPDIRVIVFRGIPVMAMMRLSCAESQGKANLHQGAIGVGIDMASGCAVNAVKKDMPIAIHPDTQADLMGLRLPMWRRLLELSCACADMTGLGYLGVDIVIDQHLGPMLLELNARPGLSIQIANREGLIPRLNRIEQIKYPHRWTIAERLNFASEHFGRAAHAEHEPECG